MAIGLNTPSVSRLKEAGGFGINSLYGVGGAAVAAVGGFSKLHDSHMVIDQSQAWIGLVSSLLTTFVGSPTLGFLASRTENPKLRHALSAASGFLAVAGGIGVYEFGSATPAGLGFQPANPDQLHPSFSK